MLLSAANPGSGRLVRFAANSLAAALFPSPIHQPAAIRSRMDSSPPAKILIIDDAARLRSRLEDFLGSHRFLTASLPDGREAVGTIADFDPDLVLLDVMLPGEDGFGVLDRIRSASTVPVIMLTAVNSKTDRVKGLERGADDYIGKPFSLGELLARIKAVLRRARPEPAKGAAPAEILSSGPFSLDAVAHRLVFDGGGAETSRSLTLLEFRLFHHFLANAGEVLTRDQILAHLFDHRARVEGHCLNVYVNRLRKILSELGADPRTLATVWGRGYKWDPVR